MNETVSIHRVLCFIFASTFQKPNTRTHQNHPKNMFRVRIDLKEGILKEEEKNNSHSEKCGLVI